MENIYNDKDLTKELKKSYTAIGRVANVLKHVITPHGDEIKRTVREIEHKIEYIENLRHMPLDFVIYNEPDRQDSEASE